MEELLDGITAKDLFSHREGVTYKDFLILPGYIDFAPGEVSLKTKVSRNIELSLPVLSSPMDTVTESDMAISQALIGGLGIIHNNLSIEEQAKQVERE